MKNHFRAGVLMAAVLLINSCSGNQNSDTGNSAYAEYASILEASLFDYIIDPWYPRCIDSMYGGYISSFEYDWKVSDDSQHKALVQQTRHLWTTSFLYENYPEHKEFLEYADHGFSFIKENFPDSAYGGLYAACERNGEPHVPSLETKTSYGHAFAIHGFAKYYEVTGSQEALDLGKDIFYWLDKHAHDSVYGGYFEVLSRSGEVRHRDDPRFSDMSLSPMTGLKEFNSSLHILEGLTELYRVWPDPLVKKRLEEMYLIFRDTFIHPDGYLKLYFYPDWELVPQDKMKEIPGGSAWYTQHVTFGHDVETAFLMREAAHALGIEGDKKMEKLTKALVDHSLENGWDKENGGFYYMAYKEPGGGTTIYDNHKAFWVCSEGLNALLLMDTQYPEDPHNYFKKFTSQWEYIDKWLIDKEHGGWYSYGLDNYPENKQNKKSHNWKATYHDVRGVVNCINMLSGKQTL